MGSVECRGRRGDLRNLGPVWEGPESDCHHPKKRCSPCCTQTRDVGVDREKVKFKMCFAIEFVGLVMDL